MKANAIICEYNPFHNGHKYQIDCIKKKSENPIVAIMSGNFTQRGDIAIFNKFARAKYACENGADLVIELPTVFAISGAESFARAGVEIAEALCCTENLCLSAENNTDLLYKARDAFSNEYFNKTIKENMNKGYYYPQAVENAMEALYGKDVADVITQPNNILGVEYLKALTNTSVKAMIINRIGVGHDEEICIDNITSASNIRKMILENNNSYLEFLPYDNVDVTNTGNILNLEKIILYKLRCMSVEDFTQLPDVNEGLENRLCDAVKKFNSLSEILDYVKTKRYTMARLRRIIVCALLNIKEDMLRENAPYIRVLAFNNKGEQLLSEIKKGGKLPLITNVADGYKKLNNKAKRIFDVDILASDIYSLGTNKVQNTKSDFIHGIIKV